MTTSLRTAPRTAGGAAYVDGFGTARRVQALCRIGWSLAELARITGRTVEEFEVLVRAEPVPLRVAYLIAALYDRLATGGWRRGSSADENRSYAAERGWVPPMGWTAETIDDPAALPAGTPGSGPELLHAWLVNYRLLAAQGLTRKQIAVTLRTKPALIKDRLRRARRHGWVEPATPCRWTSSSLKPCGTRAAWMRHWRRGEPIDEACRQALRDYSSQHRSGVSAQTHSGAAA